MVRATFGSTPTAHPDTKRLSEALTPDGRTRLRGYVAARWLEPGPVGPRLLATRAGDGEAVVLHAVRKTLANSGSRGRDARRFLELVSPLRRLEHAHILPISDALTDEKGWHWLVTPYTGSSDGLLSLADLVQLKPDRQLSPFEVERSLRQLLGAVEAAHDRSIVHGPIDASEIQVDRHGSLAIEFYGLRRRVNLSAADDADDPNLEAAMQAEVRSIAALAYALLTGFAAPEPFFPASRLVRRLDRRLDDWLTRGLMPAAGYADAGEALAALDGRGPDKLLNFPTPRRLIATR